MRVRLGLIGSLAAVLASCGGGSASHGTGGSAAGGAAPGGSNGGAAGASGGAGTGGDAGTGGVAGTGGGAGTVGGAGTGGASVDAAVDQPIATDAPVDQPIAGDAGDDAIVCTPTERPALRGAPDILILLDASGSMNNDAYDMGCGTTGCGAVSKWALVVPAINQIVSATESSVNWGLKFFADIDNRCGVGTNVAVPVGAGNAAAIAAAIAARTTTNGGVANGSQTPTRVAETVAADVLSALTDSNPKFILLATDGLPNCLSTAQPQNDDSPGAINAVSDTAARGFPTFVVGIATAGLVSDYTLSRMAIVGGRPRAGDPAYYPVTTTDELRSALDGIVGQAGTCTLGIGTPPAGGSLDAIEVRGDHAPIARDTTHASGWDYADLAHTSISLFGPPCAAVRSGAVQQITIGFLCLP